MALIVRKGLLGKEDIRFYTAASPTFTRTTSYGAATPITSVSATHIPITNGSGYWSVNNVQRALKESLSRYFLKQHSGATYSAGAGVGDHVNVFGFRNALAATSIQAAASNSFLRDGIARIFIPNGTFTVATPIQIPRKAIIFGNGDASVIRGNATLKVSRIFSISGTVGATTSNINSNVLPGSSSVVVVNGALFSTGQEILIEDSHNSEVKKITNVVGNTLSVAGHMKHFYRTAATTKKVTVCYSAKVEMDDFVITGSGFTSSAGISATTMSYSVFGQGLRINSAATGIRLNKNCNLNRFNFYADTLAGANHPAVAMSDKSSYDNLISPSVSAPGSGNASGGGLGNFQLQVGSGADFNLAGGNGLPNVLGFSYRNNKPTLSYTTYSVSGNATIVVTCPASTTSPAEVFINGSIYRNTGTILCDISRTKLLTNATVGGMDRGPATATSPIYMYAVPSHFPTATRQWDLFGSLNDPSSGPVSGTFPLWSNLGVINTGATVRAIPFVQTGDYFQLGNQIKVVDIASVGAQRATYRQVTYKGIPVGAKSVKLHLAISQPAAGAMGNNYQYRLANGNEKNVTRWDTEVQTGFSTAVTSRMFGIMQGDVSVNATRQFAYNNNFPAAGATIAFTADIQGFVYPRGNFK